MNIGKLFKRIVLVGFILAIVAVATFSGLFIYNMSPIVPDEKDDRCVVIEVEKNMSNYAILKKLEDEGLIRSEFYAKIYLKFFSDDKPFIAGRYCIFKSEAANDIIEVLKNGENAIIETKKVAFIEGKRFPYYVTKMAENFDFDEQSVYNLTTDKDFLNKLIEKYWFIDDSILNKDLKYPLEGYLFPDTYEFKIQSTAEEVLYKLLDEMENKLSKYKDTITNSKYTAHEILTLASIVELEGRTPEDRKVLAGVFYNRLDQGISLGSDVTTYYAEGKEMTEKIYQSELDACNAYNTRGNCVKGLPVGPICSPSLSSIVGAIEPTKTSYIYFVADKNTKLYFGETYADHQRNISDLKKNGLWPE